MEQGIGSRLFAAMLVEVGYATGDARTLLMDLVGDGQVKLNSRYEVVDGTKTVLQAMQDAIINLEVANPYNN